MQENQNPTANTAMSNRSFLYQIIESTWFQNTVVSLIIINAFVLGLETSPSIMVKYGVWLKVVDQVILKIFTLEILLRIYVHRLKFFKSPWCLFDLCVVAIAYIPASEAFAALRTLRVLRVLRLITTIPSMRRVIEGLLQAIPGIMSVCAILIIIYYVFAVIGTHLFAAEFPDWFGNLGRTMFTLFQVMTLESWSMGIVRPVMEVYPYAWIFFMLYILISTFTMLNLFIAIIVNAMHRTADESAEESRHDLKDTIQHDIAQLETRMLNAIDKIKQSTIKAID